MLASSKSKKGFILIVSILLAVGIFFSIGAAHRPTKTSYMHGSFTIDINDTAQLVGDADYVFVGTVTDEASPIYEDDLIYTPYTVDVLENIKGDLMTDKEIPILKFGGLAKDHSAYYVFEDDALPIVDKTYIFCAYAQEDGSLMVSGPRSNVELSTETTVQNESAAFRMASEYTEFQNAAQNQIVSDRERFVSIYEAKTDA